MSTKTMGPRGTRLLRERGLTLIELIIFIVIVSAALAGVLAVLNITTRSSADPLIRKQMLAIAEGILEEVQMQPFTWCDPDDANAATATGAAACAGGTAAETRSSTTAPFDNVIDYSGASISTNIATAAFPTGYVATVGITSEALGTVPLAASLRIAVTVTHGSDTLVLEGYRTRYAPNSLP